MFYHIGFTVKKKSGFLLSLSICCLTHSRLCCKKHFHATQAKKNKAIPVKSKTIIHEVSLIVLIYTCALQYFASFCYFTHASNRYQDSTCFLSTCCLTKYQLARNCLGTLPAIIYIFMLLVLVPTKIFCIEQEKTKHVVIKVA